MKKKDKLLAKVSFYLSLGFWVPLFNIAMCLVSIYLAIRALNNYLKDNTKYGGLYYIIFALVLSVTAIVLSIIGLIVYLNSSQFCNSAICQLSR